MTEREFLNLTSQRKADFVNERLATGMKLEEIAKGEFNRSRSWLSKKLNEVGYFNLNGREYLKRVEEPYSLSEEPRSSSGELAELLRHRESLVALAKQYEASNAYIPLNFSELENYKGEIQVTTIRLKKGLLDELESIEKKLGAKRNNLISLALHHFIVSHR